MRFDNVINEALMSISEKSFLKEPIEYVLVFNDGSSYKKGDTIPKCPFNKTDVPVTIKSIENLNSEEEDEEEVDENGISYTETRYAICLTYAEGLIFEECTFVSQITTEGKIEVFNYDGIPNDVPLNFYIAEQSHINKQAYKDHELGDMIDF